MGHETVPVSCRRHCMKNKVCAICMCGPTITLTSTNIDREVLPELLQRETLTCRSYNIQSRTFYCKYPGRDS